MIYSILKTWRTTKRQQSRFDEAMTAHGAAIGRLAASFAPVGAAREDLEQEIVIGIWRALPHFKQQCSLKTYVFRIAYNRCIDELRRGKFNAQYSADDVDELPETNTLNPELQAVVTSQLERIASQLRTLPIAQRQAFVLALEGCTHEEIAAIVGTSISNVAVRIHRARTALRRMQTQENQ